jgi:hypothetical protein
MVFSLVQFKFTNRTRALGPWLHLFDLSNHLDYPFMKIVTEYHELGPWLHLFDLSNHLDYPFMKIVTEYHEETCT